ncbi:MAG: YegS/Rv2252/BmrU family lipid kinase [Gemmatimonadota bacterium]|nr:YegS/Rv2252/BmrU family lipid kinase [Gemmatimonadota bacterium]
MLSPTALTQFHALPIPMLDEAGGKRLTFVIHGERAGNPALRHLVEWVRGKGHDVDPRVTWERGDGVRLAREAAMAGADIVVAIGGDGTVNEVVNGLAQAAANKPGAPRPSLGIVPFGTANDFARQAGIPSDDPDHAMDFILQRKPVLVDTGEMNGRRFLNVSTAGVGAEATAETPAEAKASLGPLAYAITGARKLGTLEPYRAKFTAPGFELESEFLLFAVGNARSTGGGTLITPRATVTDGLLDLCVVEAMPIGAFARLLLRLKKGEHLDDEGVHYRQLPSLTVRASVPISVNLDGESSEAMELFYLANPGALLVHVGHLPGEAEES